MGEYVVLDELPEELLVGETDEMPPMLFQDNRVVIRRSKKDRRKLLKLLRCRTCCTRTTHLKKHVLRHHVCRRWWFLYPLKACWSCKRHEIALHAAIMGHFARGTCLYFHRRWTSSLLGCSGSYASGQRHSCSH